ncbi:choice-of-anchor H family protein [Aestuariibacter salexigens]|uniref:choice-of-anchor H family protein n=1 Tax=Aestuariibacter salexigens TaxID=226010 RepID=UPI0004178C04|nr:choice-of-anchor H family protein [Aestuariibacter salexigens]
MQIKTLFASILALPLVASAQTTSDEKGTGTMPLAVKTVETQFGSQKPERAKSSAGFTLNLNDNTDEAAANDRWAKKNSELQKTPSSQTVRSDIRTYSEDFWIYDAWTSLDVDNDYDGYYHRFSVEFDADTVYSSAWVYARIYLGRGDIFDEIHTTSVFMINGDNSDDSLIIESELVSGFPTDEYEVLIELYDAEHDELVAITDGYSDADLSYLSLESANYELVYEEPPVVIVEEYGGSTIWWAVVVLSAVVGWRRKRSVC